jgi:TolB-like protein
MTDAASCRSDPSSPRSTRRASVAMMPLQDLSADAAPARHGMADALAHDVITRLAKLRSLFVIAQGTVLALHERRIGAEQAGRMLNVDYVISGSLRRDGTRLTVNVELVETRSARIVWTEVFAQALDDVFVVLDEIGNRIVACVASEIETGRAQPRRAQAAQFTGRVGGAPPRPVAHVSLQPGRQRARTPLLRDGRAPGPVVLARLCRAVVHAFPECVPGLGRARARHRPGAGRRAAEPAGRRARSGGLVGDGACAVAARPPRRGGHRTAALDRVEPELRARPLFAVVRAGAGG